MNNSILNISLNRGTARIKAALFLGIIAFVIAFSVSVNSTAIAELLRPAMSPEVLSGMWGRVSCAFVMGIVVSILTYFLLALPEKLQSRLVWGLLAIGALSAFYSFDLSFTFIGNKIPFLISQGAVTTIYVSAISILLAFIFAMLGATAKLSGISILKGIGDFYTSYFRGVPLLVQLFLIYLGLPQLGLVIDPIPAAIAALSLVYGAYMTEIFRSGIQSISMGQWEAADALGLARMRTFQKVILPQAMRLIVPPTGNQFIAMLKDSSLVSVVGVWDIMFIARTQGRADFKILEMLITASIIYWMMSMLLEVLQNRIESHYAKSLKH
ncbi:amino acid ABC transporter permease ['Osedax' symbiont bacterium Rs2_46_30_T18]|nr:amino acid ABC transporter permease ['Osedax' symbiont bacterium Rs2_46_30_T18]